MHASLNLSILSHRSLTKSKSSSRKCDYRFAIVPFPNFREPVNTVHVLQSGKCTTSITIGNCPTRTLTWFRVAECKQEMPLDQNNFYNCDAGWLLDSWPELIEPRSLPTTHHEYSRLRVYSINHLLLHSIPSFSRYNPPLPPPPPLRLNHSFRK